MVVHCFLKYDKKIKLVFPYVLTVTYGCLSDTACRESCTTIVYHAREKLNKNCSASRHDSAKLLNTGCWDNSRASWFNIWSGKRSFCEP